MTTLYGILGMNDGQNAFTNVLGQQVVYDAIQQLIAEHTAELNAASSLFIDGTTTKFKFRYVLPGGGTLQRRGTLGPSGAKKRAGKWDVSLPIFEFGDALGGDRIQDAYMTVEDLNAHIESVKEADRNTMRQEILMALLDANQYPFEDDINGTLTITPAANGDAVLYPPQVGATAEATEDLFLRGNYAVAAISDTNNPVATIVDKLEAHYGAPTGGSPILVLCAKDVGPVLATALTDFVDVPDYAIAPGVNTATTLGLPAGVPGKILGRTTTKGAWVSQWDWLPSTYMVGIHLTAPKPLRKRVDLVETGLPSALSLVYENEKYPLSTAQWVTRYGIGVVNRLNSVAMQVATGGSTYTIPTGFAH